MKRDPIHHEAARWACAAAMGFLNAREDGEWNDHLANCPSCQKLYEKEMKMGILLKKALTPESPDPGLEGRIIRNFRQNLSCQKDRWTGRWIFGPVPIGAAIGIIVLMAIGVNWMMREVPSKSGALRQSFASLPPAVKSTICSQTDGKTIEDIEHVNDDGDSFYNIVARLANKERRHFTVAPDGTLLTVEAQLTELPASVRAAIVATVGNGQLEGIDKTFNEGDVTYVAGITRNGLDRDFTFEQDGTLSSVEVDPSALPSTVRSVVASVVGHNALEGIDQTLDGDKTTYEGTMIVSDGEERDFTISADGKLLDLEVPLTEAPLAVRQTIAETLGDGRVEEVNRSFVSVNHMLPYEVQAQKDGKPFDFEVDPSGRFICRED